MNNPWDIISELESDNSRLFKESVILREAEANNTQFFTGVKFALDNLITFGVKKVPVKTDNSGVGLGEDSFLFTLEQLRTRKLTGNAALACIDNMMSIATKDQWNNWYRRILIKDLRCGVSDKTINKAVGKTHAEYSVPVFSCQLAHDGNNHESKISGIKMVQNKLDGVRVLTVVYPDGNVNQFSRNGKELLNFDHIKKAFSKIAHSFSEPMVFDGEVMSSSFQDLMKQVHRKEDVNSSDAVLYLFDILPLDSFLKGIHPQTQEFRTDRLESIYDYFYSHLHPHVRVLGSDTINLDTFQGLEEFESINRSAIQNGFEGIMLKDPDAFYECKRTTSWLKIKPYIEVTLTVVSTEEGTGKNQGMMGALVCEGYDDGKFIQVNVGSGFTEPQRKDFWDCKVDGYQIEVRADAITQNQDGSYSLRFPRFKTFRGFVKGEKM